MAELADALDSKSCALTGVWVRLPPPAVMMKTPGNVAFFLGFSFFIPPYLLIENLLDNLGKDDTFKSYSY